MKLSEIRDEFRSQVSDEQAPYLWSDDEVLRYAVDAQDMFVRLTGGIPDVTRADPGDDTETWLLDLVAAISAPYAAFSPYILRIRSARLLTARKDIRIVQEGDLSVLRTRDYGITDVATLADDDTGEVRAMILGIKEHSARFWHVPAAADTVRLNVFRLPFPRLDTWADNDTQLEIDEQHHRHLITWMKHLAYGKSDAECFDKGKAAQSQADFEAYCLRAKSERQRLAYRPRVVQYGGL